LTIIQIASTQSIFIFKPQKFTRWVAFIQLIWNVPKSYSKLSTKCGPAQWVKNLPLAKLQVRHLQKKMVQCVGSYQALGWQTIGNWPSHS
jgi:hypothetical protein